MSKDAKTVARALFENVYLIYGPFKQLLSDCGTEYLNETLKELLSLINVKQLKSTAYHHQTVGTVERNHRNLNEYLRSYIKDTTDWENYIKYYTFCYNVSPHAAFNDKYSPFEIIFGKNIDLPLALKSTTVDPIYNVDNYAREVKYRMQAVNKKVHELIIKNKITQKNTYDKKTRPIDLKLQDKVLLVDYTSHKLKPIYKGPYIITKIDNNNVELLNINNQKTLITHKNNIRKYMA